MSNKPTIFIGADHGGFALKKHLAASLEKQGYTVCDQGTDSDASCDYPDFIFRTAEAVAHDAKSRGIVICTTGIGASICANKVAGARASLCVNTDQAVMTRRHNDANVLALGAKYVTPADAEAIVAAWLNEPFEGGRHQRRIDKITAYEKKGSCDR